jgi:hypothetical protein
VSAHQLYDGSVRPDSGSLQRRRSRGRSSDSGSTPSVLPRRLQSLLIWGGGAPDVHVSLVAGEGHDPDPAVAVAGGTAPDRMGKSAAAVDAAGRSGAVPETEDLRRAVLEHGSKRTAPEQGSSDRPVKKARVRSKM